MEGCREEAGGEQKWVGDLTGRVMSREMKRRRVSRISFVVIEISAEHRQSIVSEVCAGNEMRSVCEKRGDAKKERNMNNKSSVKVKGNLQRLVSNE